MKISPDFVQEIKFRNKIDDVISSYVNLKRAGSNFVGLCPFHSEKTPSFTVFRNTETYHCFGCGAGGDVITFIMQAENLDYIGALEFLCNRVGMQMPEDDGKSETVKRSRFYDMNREAARFFNKSLYSDAPGAAEARKYVFETRGLPKSAVTHFGLGYAPDSFSALRDHMRSLGYRDEELAEGFLCGRSNKNGGYFDYFRGRVIFPIIDNIGNVIGFGGRAMGDAKPKYLNSSDTPVFKKSRNLYSLNFARTNCADGLILCEGYMDVIGVNLAGFSNAVATLGTALTEEQARIMAKYTKKVIIAYDSDGAGVNATKRAIPILSDAGLEVKVLHMEGAKDPDEYVRKFGRDKFRALINGSSGKLDFLLNSVLGKYDVNIAEDKIKAAEELCAIAADIYSDIEREVYIAKIADVMKIDTASVKNDTERIRRKKKYEAKENEKRKIVMATMGIGDTVNRDYAKYTKAAHAEESILGMLFMYPEYIEKIRNGSIELSQDDFVTEFDRRVFAALLERGSGGGFGMLADAFSPEEISRMSEMQVARQALSDNSEKVLKDTIDALREAAKNYSHNATDDLDAAMRIIQSKKTKK
ncbi:MAG: DNA primase [Clostridia bacterium]|nr:DNA primase [Clostridia bacterium]